MLNISLISLHCLCHKCTTLANSNNKRFNQNTFSSYSAPVQLLYQIFALTTKQNTLAVPSTDEKVKISKNEYFEVSLSV